MGSPLPLRSSHPWLLGPRRKPGGIEAGRSGFARAATDAGRPPGPRRSVPKPRLARSGKRRPPPRAEPAPRAPGRSSHADRVHVAGALLRRRRLPRRSVGAGRSRRDHPRALGPRACGQRALPLRGARDRAAARAAGARGGDRGARVRRAHRHERRQGVAASGRARARQRAGAHRARGRGLGRVGRLQARARPHVRALRGGALPHVRDRVDLRAAGLSLAPGSGDDRGGGRVVARERRGGARERALRLRLRQGAAPPRLGGRRDRPHPPARRRGEPRPRVSRRGRAIAAGARGDRAAARDERGRRAGARAALGPRHAVAHALRRLLRRLRLGLDGDPRRAPPPGGRPRLRALGPRRLAGAQRGGARPRAPSGCS